MLESDDGEGPDEGDGVDDDADDADTEGYDMELAYPVGGMGFWVGYRVVANMMKCQYLEMDRNLVNILFHLFLRLFSYIHWLPYIFFCKVAHKNVHMVYLTLNNTEITGIFICNIPAKPQSCLVHQ